MMSNLSPLAALEVVLTTTSSDNNVGITATLGQEFAAIQSNPRLSDFYAFYAQYSIEYVVTGMKK